MVAKVDAQKFFKGYEKVYNDAIAGDVNLQDSGTCIRPALSP